MKSASVKQFVALRAALLSEKAQLEARLKEICAGLEMTAPVAAAPAKPAALGRPPKKKRAARVENTMSLYEAVNKAVAANPIANDFFIRSLL